MKNQPPPTTTMESNRENLTHLWSNTKLWGGYSQRQHSNLYLATLTFVSAKAFTTCKGFDMLWPPPTNRRVCVSSGKYIVSCHVLSFVFVPFNRFFLVSLDTGILSRDFGSNVPWAMHESLLLSLDTCIRSLVFLFIIPWENEKRSPFAQSARFQDKTAMPQVCKLWAQPIV